jgi:hypothetical protein
MAVAGLHRVGQAATGNKNAGSTGGCTTIRKFFPLAERKDLQSAEF